jgi:hypothetical protein
MWLLNNVQCKDSVVESGILAVYKVYRMVRKREMVRIAEEGYVARFTFRSWTIAYCVTYTHGDSKHESTSIATRRKKKKREKRRTIPSMGSRTKNKKQKTKAL